MVATKEDRLQQIEDILRQAKDPISGGALAKKFDVSRQVIVQDISLLRARQLPIASTYKGYIMKDQVPHQRIFKVFHTDEDIVTEMNQIVDLGACIEDVFIQHRIYGEIRADMKVKSRKDVEDFMEGIYTSVSSPLKNITNNYHFHTISADDEKTLDQVEAALGAQGFLVKD
ncbi:MAG: transcription repressor NadR [Tissierellia bacterium]|nr:transcription repressor NadR [Tissierellia bacterium]